MTKQQFIAIIREATLSEGEEVFKAKYNAGEMSYFAIREAVEDSPYGPSTYLLYGISADGEEVWCEDVTNEASIANQWPCGDENEI